MRSILTNSGRRRPFRSTLGIVAALAIAVSGLTFGTIVSEATTTESASAATAAGFDPGNIISDANFYNGSAMSGSAVQSFLNSAGANCRQASGGPACLKDFTQNMSAIAAVSGRCSAIPGGSKSAATMIAQVGSACGISQKVLLVLLQKEQAIVSTSRPTSYMYLHATGFACPDTAPCDPKYYGFGQQVYAAALQFKRYQASPTAWAYQAGRNNAILYNPNAACGRKTVYITNQATAALYIYTPYTPNSAAMANLYGTGDSCSAYGNRNFWRMYTDWFGSPTGGSSPIGHVDSVSAGYKAITVTGWAADPDTTAPLRVAFYIDGVGKQTITANTNRTDLASRLGANNTTHGFSTTLSNVSGGSHNLCVYGINQGAGANTLLSCQTFSIRSGDPFGSFDSAAVAASTLTVGGWAIDPDSTGPVQVQVRVDGTTKTTVTANTGRGDVGKRYPGYGNNHGFSAKLTGITAGKHTIQTYVQDTSSKAWKLLGTKSVERPSGAPWLILDEVSSKAPGTMRVRGWTIDPDTTASVRVHVYLDGKALTAVDANKTKTGLGTARPGYGDDHAYLFERGGISAGKHTACVIAINVGPGINQNICRTFSTPTGSPKVTIDKAATAGLGSITISGSAVDPDVTAAVPMSYTVDGKTLATGTANVAKAALATTYPGYGADHAFAQTITGVGPGAHTVCAVGKNVGGGSNTSVCAKVAAATGDPVLLLDEVSSPAAGQVKVRGWSIDPDVAGAVQVHVYIGGKPAQSVTANQAKAGIATSYAGYGGNHAFSTTLGNRASGSTEVCVFAINQGSGSNTEVCRTITVR
ncbi:hypothetical protein SAMN02800687_2608 [Curtobacterium sp. UNCCL20]|uniref:hypothetical protein n=1 Tax=Curtobacterium sp. UNCCL20 TaxID=1502773 RepID=UPI00087FBA28|nr:hypothetical protein [Curtobacterium sp. UNCCL20]SDQ73470.1 hypothetical protein SAMN02800687_2608 [Curtobacterium sp. UNCCL20]